MFREPECFLSPKFTTLVRKLLSQEKPQFHSTDIVIIIVVIKRTSKANGKTPNTRSLVISVH